MTSSTASTEKESLDFVREIAYGDLASGKHPFVVTRFPPEPNGYLHIGHAKSICLNFGLGRELPGSRTHLRFDDTNPVKEDIEYVESIQTDVKWLGFEWGEHLYHASDYFDQIHAWAEELIRNGKAFVCDHTADEVRQMRGTLTEPGRHSVYRDRPVEENLDLFGRMRAGEFPDGAKTLRAKIDMASANVNLRDPVLYRIKHVPHDRTGDKWCIYPTYDMAHGYSDAIEGITHSICTLEFEDHRPLYDWLIENVSAPCHPRQIEFARLNLTCTVMSKRKLLELVETGSVDAWDDPRMPTISGLRRRGFTPESIRNFCGKIGVTKTPGMTDVGLLEYCVREHLNASAQRCTGVIRPIRLVVTDWPEGKIEDITFPVNPADPAAGERILPFTGTVFIDADDFMENPPPKFFRLGPGKAVRLRGAYNVTCNEVVKDAAGTITELRCTHDSESRNAPPKKGQAAIHWISEGHCAEVEVRLYDRLFTKEDMNDLPEGQTWKDFLNPGSLEVLQGCKVEASALHLPAGACVQFERVGYFCVDSRYSCPGAPVFNRTVTLKETWAKPGARP